MTKARKENRSGADGTESKVHLQKARWSEGPWREGGPAPAGSCRARPLGALGACQCRPISPTQAQL